jgi:hypothetical protein
MPFNEKNAWKSIRETWSELIKSVQRLPPHVDLLIHKSIVDEPWLFGFRKSLMAWKKGSLRNWRLALPNGRCIHVREYKDHFKIHWDIADPRKNPFKHLVYDTQRLFNTLKLSFFVSTAALFVYRPETIQAIMALFRAFVVP